MPLSWNEIRSRSLAFSREWANETSEDAEAKSFWDGFFDIFGVSRRRLASFEAPVKKEDGKGGFIDLLWRGVLLVEHKSRGRDLDRAARQALDYFPGLKDRDLPRYVLVSDFARFRLFDLDTNEEHDFPLTELHSHVRLFGFMAGYQTRSFGQEDPVNIKAAERLGRLHDLLKTSGYEGHPLEVFLVRLLFCMFAEDTALFERRQFQDYLEQRTSEDGTDLGMHLAQLFQVLDTPAEKRPNTLDEQLAAFPYVNGQLFSELLPIAACDRIMREALLDCCALDWSRISPAVFGSLFQSIMDAKARRAAGAHYTNETNILRLIRPLFLDALWAEFHKVKNNRNRLFEFLKKLSRLRFLDPACGCGNFLVIAYRELRLLELEVLRHVRQSGQLHLDVFQLISINVDQFHGIEIEEWPARIAEVALWLTDHQMNLKVSEEFGQYFARLPLKVAPHIVHGNALAMDWNEVIPAERLDYLLGNPPFVGKHYQTKAQKTELVTTFGGLRSASDLDYVACWYRKAAEYMTCAHPLPYPTLSQGEGASLPSPSGRRAGDEGLEVRIAKGKNKGKRVKLPLPPEHLEFARSLRNQQTDAETLIWLLLRNRRLAGVKFRRQHPLPPYVLDFYCHEARLAVELDGGQHLESPRDSARDSWLKNQGITVLRYWDNEALLHTDAVLEDIWRALNQAGVIADDNAMPSSSAPHPQPFSQGEKGEKSRVKAAFVSTNSITQGEQVGILWPDLFQRGLKIHFAHRTFQWNSEARGKAAVHCVIIGFGLHDVAEKWLFDYDTPRSEPHAVKAANINPYLTDAPDVIALKRRSSLMAMPVMRCGNKPSDGGNLLLTPDEKNRLLHDEPAATPWLRRYVGSEEFINGIERWCLWLDGISPQQLRKLPQVLKRVEAVRDFRLKSSAEPTRRAAENPGRFFFVSQPDCPYILVPEVSSERRRYVPLGFMPSEVISSNTNYLVAEASLYLFGLLQSAMHMAWLATVGGRLESRYRYSASIVYNTFPWPEPNDKQRAAIEAAAQAVLDIRAQFPDATLADLYDPLTMPPVLLKAHQALDRVVDAAYGVKGFKSEAERVAFLFTRYQQLLAASILEKKT